MCIRDSTVARELQAARVLGGFTAEVRLTIRPVLAPARLQQDDRPGADHAPLLLETTDVLRLQTIAVIPGRLLAHVDADRRCDQLRERELVRRHALARKVNRC